MIAPRQAIAFGVALAVFGGSVIAQRQANEARAQAEGVASGSSTSARQAYIFAVKLPKTRLRSCIPLNVSPQKPFMYRMDAG